MQPVRRVDGNGKSAPDRGADASAPRSSPLTLVAGAVAGDDLQSVAATVAEALGRAVAIAIPALGAPVVAPPGSLSVRDAATIVEHAGAVIAGANGSLPNLIADSVAVRIGDHVVGLVIAAGHDPSPAGPLTEQRAWLEAAAAAASVTALIRETHDAGAADSGQALMTELAAAPPEDIPSFLARARRLGHELASGAVAICAWRPDTTNGDAPVGDASAGDATAGDTTPGASRPTAMALMSAADALVAERTDGRWLALSPLGDGDRAAAELVLGLRDSGLSVCVSTPRRDPAALHQAIVEVELLVELSAPTAPHAGHEEETYRLLIGVLLRNRQELEQLRDRTITPLAEYDVRHDTELLATLHAFLTHDGSTTETAEAMRLHRHTVGYRLSRVHEVSGLSPYASDGRERLSLGIKANQILDAERRRR